MFVFQKIANNLNQLNQLSIDLMLKTAMDNKQLLESQNRQQLWDGTTILDKEIRPFHSENDYFKSQKQVDAYIKWKEKFTSNSKRNKNVPNLYINGTFYKEIAMEIKGDSFAFDAKGVMASKIKPVFKDILGLTEENINNFTFKLLLPILHDKYLKLILEK